MAPCVCGTPSCAGEAREAATRRHAASVTLWNRGYTPRPLRLDTPAHEMAHRWIFGHIQKYGRNVRQDPYSMSRLRDVRRDFRHHCQLYLVTGGVGGVVAVETWTDDAAIWVLDNLPDTPAVADTPSGVCFFYRLPEDAVWSRHYLVGDAPFSALLRVHGEFSGVTILPSSYRDVSRWPPSDDLPMFSEWSLVRGNT